MKPKINPPHCFSLIEILARSNALQHFVSKAENLTRLNRLVLKFLDPTLAAHCQVTHFNNNILTLTANSPVFGHKLRFFSSDLLSLLRKDPMFSALKAIESKVRPEEVYIASCLDSLPRPQLTAFSADIIQDAAQEIRSLKLSQSLFRLAKRYEAVAGYK